MASRGHAQHSVAGLRGIVRNILQSNIDKYNPDNIRTMEDYVEAQPYENHYDLEANLLLLKLYQLNPGGNFSAARASFVAKVLLLALMQLPKNDFQICKALTEPDLTKVLKIQDVLSLETLLETCQFEAFWQKLATCQEVVSTVEGFDGAIREYICSVIGMTNQSIRERQLQAYLGGLGAGQSFPYDKFKQLVEKKGWSFDKSSGYVFVTDQTSRIKPRKITEAIDFADVATILSAAARH